MIRARAACLGLVAFAALGSTSGRARADEPSMSTCLAANEKSISLRNDHKLGQARDQALVCAAASCPEVVREKCRKRVADLSSAIPTVVFVAKDGAGNDLIAVRVSMDGAPIVDHLDGTAIAVDPGPHVFRFELEGQPAVEQSLVINEGQKDRREVVTIGPLAPVVATVILPPEVAPGSAARARTQRVTGVFIGAAGVVGLGLGGIFGGLAASEWSNAKSACSHQPVSCQLGSSNSTGSQDESSASSKALISTVSFIAGGALVAAGIVVYVAAPRRGSATAPTTGLRFELAPAVGPGGTGMLLRGNF